MGPVDFVRGMEEALIRLCGGFGVRAGRISGMTGVWCGKAVDSGQWTVNSGPGTGTEGPGTEAGPGRKIGAIGIHVAKGITSHGFAFNVATDLRDFELIVPCGIKDHAVTSLEREVERPGELPGLETVAHVAARQFGMVFDQPVLALESLTALRESAAAAVPTFPAEDTPVRVPAEVERLMGGVDRPIRA
jgi:lipoyl(octanoyl) transferase